MFDLKTPELKQGSRDRLAAQPLQRPTDLLQAGDGIAGRHPDGRTHQIFTAP